MSETKFTPGPWKVCRSNEDFDGPFYELDDDCEHPINAIRSKSETIACAHDLFEFDEANANLIAAAPDLYDALETCTTYTYMDIDGDWVTQQKFDFDKVKAALAKARGEG